MAQTIKLKRSSTSGAVPTTSQLELGEVAINTYDGKMYIKKNDGSDSVVEIGGGSAGNDYVDSLSFATGTGVLTAGRTGSLADLTVDLDGRYLELSGGTLTGNLSFGDNDKAIFGAGSDLQIFHDGSNSFIQDAGTGQIRILGDDVRIMNAAGTEISAQFIQDGQARLKYDNSTKLATTSTGIDVTGTATMDGLTVGNGTQQSRMYIDADEVSELIDGNVRYDIWTGGSKTMRLASNGDISFYEDTGTTPKFFWDASKESLGIGTTSLTPTDGSNIELSSATSSRVILDSTGSGGRKWTMATGTAGSLDFYDYDASAYRLRIDSSGRVGIGTSSPSTTLEVAASATVNTDVAHFSNSNGAVKAKFHLADSTGDGQLTLYDGNNNADVLISSIGNSYLNSGGNLGIGTSSPSQELHVTSSGEADIRLQGSGSANHLDIFHNASDFGLWGTGTQVLKLATNGSERLRIDSSGNVGIGASSPSGALQIYKAGLSAYQTYTNTGTGLILQSYQSQGNPYTKTSDIVASSDGTVPSEIRLLTRTAGSSTIDERLRIDSSGRVGIGTSSPSDKVHVYSSSGGATLKVESNTANAYDSSKIELLGGNLSTSEIVLGDASNASIGKIIYRHNGNSLAFDVNAAERLRIDSSGRVGIGTSSPIEILELDKASGDTFIRFDKSGAFKGLVGIADSAASGSSDAVQGDVILRGQTNLLLDTAGTTRVKVDSSGNVGIGTSSPSQLLSLNSTEATARGISIDQAGAERVKLLYTNSTGAFDVNNTTAGYTSFSNNGAERLRIDSSGNVGIGTASPSAPLTVNGGSDNLVGMFESSDTLSYISFKDSNTTSSTSVALGASGDNFTVYTGTSFGAERLRIDSSGNLLVSKTSANSATQGVEARVSGQLFATSNNAKTMFLNRLTSDGTIAEFRKDGSTVGSIGTGGGDLNIGTGDTRIRFNDATDNIIPLNASNGYRDAAISIGDSTARFKNLYLSGTVTATGGNSTNWNTAYGWGDHSQAGYLTSYTDTNTTYSAGNGIAFDGTTISLAKTKRWMPADQGNLTTYPKYYKVATVNKGNGGLHLKGTLNNHVESFGACDFDLSIYGREGNNPAEIEVHGFINVATAGTGVLIVKSLDTATSYDHYDVYIALSRYTQATVDLTPEGTAEVFLPTTGTTTKPAAVGGINAEFDSVDETEGSYIVSNSAIYDNYHSGAFTNNSANWNTAYGWGDHSTQSYATESYVNTQVSNLVDSSPSTLNTLNELAAALGDDANFSTTVSNQIGTKWTQDNTKISNWDTAYGWGNHASAGYLTSHQDISGKLNTSAYTASDVLTKIKTVDGAGSGLDADTVDGIQASQFLRSDASDTMSGSLTINGNINLNGTSPQIKFNDSDHGDCWIHVNSNRFYVLPDRDSSGGWETPYALELNWSNNTAQTFGNTIWTSGNDGSGSGLDADTLDGNHASVFAPKSAPDFTGEVYTDSSQSAWAFRATTGTTSNSSGLWFSGTTARLLLRDSSGNIKTMLAANGTNAENVINNNTIWHAGNDGSGSGLDADLLDGQHGSYYATSSHNHNGVYTPYDHFRHTGHGNYTSTTTSALLTEALGDDAFDSKLTAHKTSWSYAGNGDLTDAGRLTELAGTSWLWWTDNSTDNVQGNITGLAIAPNTGGSAGKMFVYNNQGSSYAPGWREIWTSTSDGSGSGLDADLLDGQQGSHYLNYNNLSNTPTIPTNNNQLTNGAGYTTYTANQAVNTTSSPTFNQIFTSNNGNGTNIRVGDDAWFGDTNVANTVQITGVQNSTQGYLVFGSSDNTQLGRSGTGSLTYGGNTVWHAGNDGSGSGLDADTVDGFNTSASPTASTIPVRTVNGDIAAREITLSSALSSSTPTVLVSMYPTTNQLVRTTPEAVRASMGAWTSGNDGSGSGLDADTVDGIQASSFLRSDANDIMGGSLTISGSNTGNYPLLSLSSSSTSSIFARINFGNTSDSDHGQIKYDQFSSNGKFDFTAGNAVRTYIDGYGTLYNTGPVYGTLFLDKDNSTYYVNPAGTSSLSTVRAFAFQQQSSSSYGFYFKNSSGTNKAQLSTGGDWTVSGNVTAYGSPSDIRLKENVENIPDALEKVNKLDGVTFNYKKDGSKSTGLIAQQLQEVLPEVVYETKDMETEEEHLAVRYGNVVGLLVEAIKELKIEVDSLKLELSQKEK